MVGVDKCAEQKASMFRVEGWDWDGEKLGQDG